ncbi:unnamed protein product [Sympodiomycopsis kandeliae]
MPPALHYCHECNTEMRPLMAPGPICPRCGGGFVEEVAESEEHPQSFEQEQEQEVDESPGYARQGSTQQSSYSMGGGGGASLDLGGILSGLFGSLTGANAGNNPSRRTDTRGGDPNTSQTHPSSSASGSGSGSGTANNTRSGSAQWGPFGVSWHTASTGPNSSYSTYSFGSRSAQAARSPPRPDDGMGGAGGASDGRYFDYGGRHDADPSASAGRDNTNFDHMFRGSGDDDDEDAPPRDYTQHPNAPPQVEALQSLFANLFGTPQRPTGSNTGPYDTVQSLLSSLLGIPASGQMGDYVFGQQGLDDIITSMMEQTQGSTAPPPASEESIEKLRRFKATDPDAVNLARNRECPTCLDTILDIESSTKEATSEGDDPPEVGVEDVDDTLILLPCKHTGHEECIVPWLQRNGTCPICRVALEPQARPQQQAQRQAQPPFQQSHNPHNPTSSSSPWSWSTANTTSQSDGNTPHHPAVSSQMVGSFPDTDEEEEDWEDDEEEEDSQEERRRRMREAAEKRQQTLSQNGQASGQQDPFDLD